MRRSFAALGVLAALALATPAMADDVSRFKIFGAVSYVSPLSSSDQTVGGITDSVQASNETGYEFGFEFRFGKWVGIEASYVDSSHDIEFGDVTIGQADLKPINLAINIHIIHSKFVDFYLAPVGAYVEWSNLDLSGGGSESLKSQTTYGAQVGIDISLGKHLAIMGGVRWLSLDAKPDDPAATSDDSVSIDPLFTRLGLGIRF